MSFSLFVQNILYGFLKIVYHLRGPGGQNRHTFRAHLEIPFCGEGPSTDAARKWLLAGVSPLVNLKSACRREVLATGNAEMLLGTTAREQHQTRWHAGWQCRGANKMGGAHGTVTRNLHFYKGRGCSGKRGVDAASAWRTIRGWGDRLTIGRPFAPNITWAAMVTPAFSSTLYLGNHKPMMQSLLKDKGERAQVHFKSYCWLGSEHSLSQHLWAEQMYSLYIMHARLHTCFCLGVLCYRRHWDKNMSSMEI